METEELYFVHRSIYEYFVVETIYSSIEKAMIELSGKSKEECAGSIVIYLKQGLITNTMSEYLQYKLLKLYSGFDIRKGDYFYQWWEEAVEKMIDNGMFYYAGGNIQDYKSIIDEEICCFSNLVKILRLILKTSKKKYMLENADKKKLERYIRFKLATCRMEERNGVEIFNLSGISLAGINLSGADLKMANLQGANLSMANLRKTDLSGQNLQGANLQGANLEETKLQETDLRWADLTGVILGWTSLQGTNIEGSIWTRDGIKKSLPQLKEAIFTYIVVKEQGEQEKVYRSEIFPDEK